MDTEPSKGNMLDGLKRATAAMQARREHREASAQIDEYYADAGRDLADELTAAREQIATLNGRVLGLEARVGRLQGDRRIIRALAKALWGIVKHDA